MSLRDTTRLRVVAGLPVGGAEHPRHALSVWAPREEPMSCVVTSTTTPPDASAVTLHLCCGKEKCEC